MKRTDSDVPLGLLLPLLHFPHLYFHHLHLSEGGQGRMRERAGRDKEREGRRRLARCYVVGNSGRREPHVGGHVFAGMAAWPVGGMLKGGGGQAGWRLAVPSPRLFFSMFEGGLGGARGQGRPSAFVSLCCGTLKGGMVLFVVRFWGMHDIPSPTHTIPSLIFISPPPPFSYSVSYHPPTSPPPLTFLPVILNR